MAADKKSGFIQRLGGLFVPKMLREEAVSSAKELGETAQSLFKAFSRVARPPKLARDADRLPAEPSDRFEFFAAQNGLSSARLAKMISQTRLNHTIFVIMSAAILAAAVVQTYFVIVRHEGLFALFQQSYAWVLTAAFGLMAFRSAIILYQLQTRRAVTWVEYLQENVALLSYRKAGEKMMRDLEKSRPVTQSPADNQGAASGKLRRLRRTFAILALSVGGIGSVIHQAFAQIATSASGAAAAAGNAAGNAVSQAAGLVAQLGPTDLSGQWLNTLFPAGVGGSVSTTDPLATMFATFNVLMLDFGGGMLLWHLMSAVVQVAHEGSATSQKWHQIWSPVRVAAGGAFLYPIKGYCLAQLVAIQCLAGGYLMANQLWTTFANLSLNSNTIASSVNNLTQLPPSDILQGILSAETCTAYANYLSVASAGTGVAESDGTYAQSPGVTVASGNGPAGSSETDPGTQHIYNFGSCGTITIGKEGGGTGTFGGFFSGSGASAQNTNNADGDYDTAVNSALQTLLTNVWHGGAGLPQDLVSQIIPAGSSASSAANGSPVVVPASQVLADYQTDLGYVSTYLQTVQSAANKVAQSGLSDFSGGLSSSAKSLGWASAGTFYLAIEQLYSNVAGLAHAGLPAYLSGDMSGMSTSDISNMLKAEAAPISLINSAAANPPTSAAADTSTGGVTPAGTPSYTLPQSAHGNPGSFEDYTYQHLSRNFLGITNGLLNDFSLSATNPMADLISEGNVMLVSGEAIMAGAIISQSDIASTFVAGGQLLSGNLAGAASTVGAAGGATLFPGVVTIVMTIGELLIAVGVVESVILPMIVYVTWLYALLNVIAFAAEFVLAAPLAAFQHMRFDGQDFVEQDQRPFYTLLFNGVLRPSLLLFGLFISTFVLSAILNVFNETFKLGIVATQGEDFIGICQTLGLVFLQVFIQYQVLTRCVALIHRVPHMVATLLKHEVTDLAGADDGRQLIVGAAGVVRGGTSKGVAGVLTKAEKPKGNQTSADAKTTPIKADPQKE